MFRFNNIKAKDIMDENINTLTLEDTVYDAMIYVLSNNIKSIPIVDNSNRLIGILSKEQLKDFLYDSKYNSYNLNDIEVSKVENNYVLEDDYVDIILENECQELFVTDEERRFKGIINKTDVLERQTNFMIKSFNSIINTIDRGVLVIDKYSNITAVNNNATKILNVYKEEAVGKKVEEVISRTELSNTIRTGQASVKELFILGGRRIITSRTPIIQHGNIIGAIALFEDITDHDKLVEELEDQKTISQILNTILENAYDGILVTDSDGYIRMISKTYCNFLGVKEEGVIGKYVEDVIENTRMHIVAKSGVAEIADLQKVNEDHMVTSRIPIFNNGKVVCVVGKILFSNVDDLNDLYKKINVMESEIEKYKGELKQINKAKYTFNSIIGESEEIVTSKQMAKKSAKTDSNVLLIGDSGTGKELFAHAIHNASPRKFGPFIKVNSAAIPSELLEAELFGYEEGAFTGAKKGGKIGKFELANGGTIFLDEIGDMPIEMQSKLLRVLQEREVEKVGGNKCRRINVRIIAATNRDLEKMVEEGKFRQDLYYRLNVFNIFIPPLRERTGDISLLCYYFLNKLSQKYYKQVTEISKEAMKCLTNHNWTGNIRELANIIERSVNIIDVESILLPKHLPNNLVKDKYKNGENVGHIKELEEILSIAEKEAIEKSIRITNGNKTKAAKLLGIGRTTFYEKIKKYDY